QGFLPRRQVFIEVAERLCGLVFDPRNLFADVAAGCRQCTQFVDLRVEFGNRLFEIKVAAHGFRHQITIGRNAPGGEADLGCVKKSSIFNCLSKHSAQNRSRRVKRGGGAGRGAEPALSGGTPPKSRPERYFCASGCRSRTRLFRRSSTTWV